MKVSDALKLLRQYPADGNAEAILANPPKLPDASDSVTPSSDKASPKKKTTEPEIKNGGQG